MCLGLSGRFGYRPVRVELGPNHPADSPFTERLCPYVNTTAEVPNRPNDFPVTVLLFRPDPPGEA